mgnify:CR=1 FL=1
MPGLTSWVSTRPARISAFCCTTVPSSRKGALTPDMAQVKTITGGYDYWLLNAKAGVIASDSHLYLFVDICDDEGTVDFFIVPSKKVSKHHYVVRHPGGNVWYGISREDVEKHQIDLKPGRRIRRSK